MTDNYDILIRKLDEFIRKYYKNQLIRGTIYTLGLMVAFFLLTSTLEYVGRFGPLARTILFYVYLAANLAVIWRFIALPLARLNRIGKVITHEQAATIIGRHFASVSDRLLNTLQLKQMQDFNPDHTDLIEASVNQKIDALRPVPFHSAIDLKQNRKYLRYALPPVFLLLILLLAAPSFITGPTDRLIHHTVYYEKPAPFSITILNDKLEAAQQEDFTVDLRIAGDEIPDQPMIEYNNTRFRLEKENNVRYHYTFKNLQKNIDFRIVTEQFSSRGYTLSVIPKPIVLNMEIELNYPRYLRKENEKLSNNGDLLIPYGTVVTWKFRTRDTRTIRLRFGDRVQELEQKGPDVFVYTGTFAESLPYSVSSSNEFLRNRDSLSFAINVIPDVYPQVNAEEYHDTVFEQRLYFKGDIRDDYGFTRLTFNRRVVQSGDSSQQEGKVFSDTVAINKGINQQAFYHFYDLGTLDLKPGQGVEYYFEVWDNDGINGPKASRSQKMFYKAPTLQELNERAEKANKELKKDMQDAIRDARDLQKKVEELNKKLLDKKEVGWQEKKQIQDLMKKQEALQQKVDEIRQQQEENTIRDQQGREMTESLLQKQEQLQELFDQLIPEEMKQQIMEMQQMLNELDKNKINDMLEKMQLNSEDLEKQLDRNLEIFKQLEFEQKLEQTRQRLDSMAAREEKLAEESQQKDADSEDLLKEQEALNREFEEFTRDMEDLEQKNRELEEPNDMPDMKQDQEEAGSEMKQGTENLKQKKNKKAGQHQKKAAGKMKEMSEKMQQMQQQMEGESMEEDIRSLRDILENLVQISFDEEKLMLDVNKVRTYDPQYLKMVQQQKKISDDLKVVEDSLFALSKRQASIKAIVNREIGEINSNVEKAMEDMTERRTANAAGKQQLVMTGINNLALLLQESLDQMQQMQQEAQGDGQAGCRKNAKGSGNMPMKSMKELQEALNKQMEQLKNQMNQQGPPMPGPGKQSMSEQLARMAAQQEAIRKELQKLRDEIAREGKGSAGNLNKLIQDMEQTETDLVNKMITNQTLMRQKEILTRLLESEKAMREREKEERRESTEAKNQAYSNPKSFFEYNKIKSRETEILKTVPPTLKPFYKNKVSAYFYNFEE